jgi:hypothetical protein
VSWRELREEPAVRNALHKRYYLPVISVCVYTSASISFLMVTLDAIHEYEAGMLDYGFRAVRNSLKAMHQTVTDSLPALMLSRVMLRAIDALPPIKRIVAQRLEEE